MFVPVTDREWTQNMLYYTMALKFDKILLDSVTRNPCTQSDP